MSLEFDATLKDMIGDRAVDWLPLAGWFGPAPGVEVMDADLSTVSGAADKILRVLDAEPWLLHFEVYSAYKVELDESAHWYNTLAYHRHRLPVRSVVILLHPRADSPQWTGTYEKAFPGEPPYVVFRYRIVRLWQVPVEELLTGGLGLLPLAPLAAVAEEALPEVVRRMEERLEREASEEEASILLAAAFILAGLRLEKQTLAQLFQGVHGMRESSGYQLILAEEAKAILLRLGRKRFGPPEPATKVALDAIHDVDRLERMSERLLEAASWQELLATA